MVIDGNSTFLLVGKSIKANTIITPSIVCGIHSSLIGEPIFSISLLKMEFIDGNSAGAFLGSIEDNVAVSPSLGDVWLSAEASKLGLATGLRILIDRD